MTTQQLIREIESEFDEKFTQPWSGLPLHTESFDRLKSFILAKLSQVLESVEGEVEGKKEFAGKAECTCTPYDITCDWCLAMERFKGLDTAISLLKEARDAANKTTKV